MENANKIRIVAEYLADKVRQMEAFSVEVGVSNRHVHLNREAMDLLFGYGSELTFKKALGQPGQYAAEEMVTVRGPKGEFKNVRILGPLRNFNQVEISRTDSFVLGIKAPLTLSGNLKDTPGVTLIGPKGELNLSNGLMVAKRHIHMTPEEAKSLNLRDGQIVSVKTFGVRSSVLGDVVVRAAPNSALEMHIDVDEANACFLSNKDYVLICPAEGM